MGENVREWCVNVLANGNRGNADLCAYFYLRAFSLLRKGGVFSLLATNTIAQGDTREVGLDQMVERGFTITRAIQSRTWTVSSATVEYAVVWGVKSHVNDDILLNCDGTRVKRISTLLEPAGRITIPPQSLTENQNISFIGCYVLGMGFVISPATAQEWIAADARNKDVLFPYLNGDNLNSNPKCLAERWVIDFNDWPEEKAKEYALPYQHILKLVKPERQRKKPDGSYQLRKPLPQRWWQYGDKRPALRRATAALEHALVITLHSSSVMPLRVSTKQIFSHALGVFATDSFSDLAILSSSAHLYWAMQYGSSLGIGVRYTPTSVFETYPRPNSDNDLESIGRTLDTERREIMLRRSLGLTDLYNLVNDPDIPDSSDADVARLREIHKTLDETVMAAYGWSDVPLNHGFHTYRKMTRWTVCPEARVEILDRLLEENQRRYTLEHPTDHQKGL